MLIFNLEKIKDKKYNIGNTKFKTSYKNCEICNSKNNELFQNCGKIGNSPGNYGYLPVRICKFCGLKFLSPRPSDKYYKMFFKLDYGASYFGSKEIPGANHLKFQNIRGKLIYDYFSKKYSKTIRILDHGCSTGLTMKPWFENNYNIKGFDPHRPSVNFGIKKYKLPIDFGFGEKLPYKKNSFELVISLGSLEHCFNLNKCLKEIHRVLKPYGEMIIRWRSNKLIGSPLEYFGHNTLKFLNRHTWEYVLKKNGFGKIKFINDKVEGYDSFEYIKVKKYKIQNLRPKQNIYKIEKNYIKEHIKYYENLCFKIKDKKIKSHIDKINFIKKNRIGLMNIGKSKSINRFFNETKYFVNFIKKIK